MQSVGPAPPTSRRPSRRKLRRWIFRIITVPLAMLVLFICAEVFVRVASRFNWVHLAEWESYPGVSYKFRGGEMDSNSRGFRGPERELEKPSGVFRIIFLGDSFVYGTVPYEKLFTKLLEDAVNAAGPSMRVEIVNLGVSGYGMPDCASLLINYGRHYDPDAVLLGFFYGNDISDNAVGEHREVILGDRILVREEQWTNKSKLWLIVRKRWKVMLYRMSHEGPTENGWGTREDIFNMAKGYMYAFDPAWRPQFNKRHWPLMAGAFAEMKSYSEAEGVPLAVISYPSEAMIDPQFAKEIFDAMGWGEGYLELRCWNTIMDGVFKNLGFPHLDITPDIEAAHRIERQYPLNDTHWNEAGNATAARAMAPFVIRFIEQHGVKFSGDPVADDQSAATAPDSAAVPSAPAE